MDGYFGSYKAAIPCSLTDLEENEDYYTYIYGYGFATRDPSMTQDRLLQRYSNGIALAMMFMLIFSSALPALFYHLVAYIEPIFHTQDNSISFVSVAAQCVTILSTNLALLIPFHLFSNSNNISLYKPLSFRRFNASLAGFGILILLAVSVIGALAQWLLSMSFSLVGVTSVPMQTTIPYTPMAYILSLINITILTPITEEFVFRGVILNTLRPFGDAFSLLVSSFLFSMAHANLQQISNTFLTGLVIGYFVLYSNCIWVGAAMHIVYNSVVAFVNGILYSVPTSKHTIFVLVIFSLYLALGILSMLYLVRKYSNMFSLHKNPALRIEKQRYRIFFSALIMMACIIVFATLMLKKAGVIS